MTETDLPRVLLARHGETAYNYDGRLRGLANPELDGLGVQQALRLAEALSDQGLSAVYSSPLQRAVHTAQIIAGIAGVTHQADNAFNDRDYGPWTGELKSDVVERFGSVDAAPGVEPTADVLRRVLPRLNSLPVAVGAPVLVVTHDAVIRPILERIQPGIEPSVPTGSWAEIQRDPRGWSVVSFDNIPVTGE